MEVIKRICKCLTGQTIDDALKSGPAVVRVELTETPAHHNEPILHINDLRAEYTFTMPDGREEHFFRCYGSYMPGLQSRDRAAERANERLGKDLRKIFDYGAHVTANHERF